MRLDKPLYLLLFFLVFISSCVASKRFNSNKNASDGLATYKGRFVLDVTCDHEQSPNKVIKQHKLPANKYAFKVKDHCPYSKNSVEQVNKTSPLNMIYIIDTTSSMQTSINAIREHIVNFSTKLEQLGWDAQFAAVGFKDKKSQLVFIDFTTAKELKDKMKHDLNWNATGGGDFQEGGQLAIEVGFDRLLIQQQKRPGSRNIMVYTSDAVSFTIHNNQDFSIDALSQRAKKWTKDIPVLQFYYSVRNDLNPKTEQNLDAEGPDKQMEKFQEISAIPGKSLPFPLNLNRLNDFSSEFMKVESVQELECQISSAQLSAQMSKSVDTVSLQKDIYQKVFNNTPILFDVEEFGPKFPYQLQITRCCKLNKNDTLCRSIENFQIPYSFGS